MTFILYGSSASRGVTIGDVHVMQHDRPDIVAIKVEEKFLESEQKRIVEAIDRTISYLKSIKSKIPSSAPREIEAFIDTHLQMVNDDDLINDAGDFVVNNRCNAEWALKLYRDDLLSVFDEMEEPYFKARRDDVYHVIDMILTNLRFGKVKNGPIVQLLKGVVVVTKDLSPADLIVLFRSGAAALIIEMGAPVSHTSILARSLGMPAVTGVSNALKIFREKDKVVVDGDDGIVLGDPSEIILRNYEEKVKKINTKKNYQEEGLKFKSSRSCDGVRVKISANLDMIDDVNRVVDVNADSVGLFRTEFLFMNRQDYPSEEEHFDCYKTIISLLGGKEFTIRTADLGADKLPQKFRSRFSNTMNSALGLRGLRFSLKEPELFIPQLKSIVRASAFGNIRLMLPMVTNTKEIEHVFEHIDLIKNELELDGVAYDKNMPIGAMIEVPSAAIAAPMFVEILDFLSIGSNDLIQYSNAVDRQDSEVSYLYEPLHFGVIKLISLTVAAGIQGKKPVSICGEMASDVRYTSLLLGLGLSELSVRPAVLFEIKERIEGISVRDSKEMVERFLETADPVILESLIAR